APGEVVGDQRFRIPRRPRRSRSRRARRFLDGLAQGGDHRAEVRVHAESLQHRPQVAGEPGPSGDVVAGVQPVAGEGLRVVVAQHPGVQGHQRTVLSGHAGDLTEQLPGAARPGPVPPSRPDLGEQPGGLVLRQEGHRGRGHRAVGHQGQSGGSPAVPAARRSQSGTLPGLRARQRTRTAGAVRLQQRAPRARFRGHPDPNQSARLAFGPRGRLQPRRLPGDSGRYDYEPARRAARPAEETWDTRAYLRHVPGVFEAVRNEFGPELVLLHDAHHRLTPLQAAQLGKSLEPHDLFWLEDVTPAEDQEALRLVRQHTTTPLAIGEVFNTVWDYQTLISEQPIDYVRSPITHAGGI